MATSQEDARQLLREAQAAHTANDIGRAIELAHRALDTWPEFTEAWMYLGTTLVARRLAFQEGLAALERAGELAPDDPGVQYSLGWCYEFVAYRLTKQSTRPFRDPDELWGIAADYLRRCIELNPEQGLREDAEDLLASIEARY